MKEDFLNIVAVIVKQMAEDDSAGPRDKSIIEGLLDDGYDLMDIDDALSWFESLGTMAEEIEGVEFWPSFRGVRVQARWEKESMSAGAYDYLMRLNRSGIVDDSFREAIIDKIMDLKLSDFGVEQMKALLGLVLYSQGKLLPDSPAGQAQRGLKGLLN
jgi:uncharacterized protein Smg (DUF494 family)